MVEPRIRRVVTRDLTAEQIRRIRALLDEAFGEGEDERFGEDDWQHALGGTHFVLDIAGDVLAHASVVERALHVAGRPLRTGYVEAVATALSRQRTGLGTLVMRDVGTYIAERFELGALGTGSHGFYERLGWVTWRGPTFVRTPDGDRRTPDEDGYIMVLRTASTPPLDTAAPISCEWRAGDVW
ncbi:MAG TPA: GNAT family N-acetyltransferase [Candidatus Limnocylindria bacterium]|nr:GNAT family N-acetyltransferase [Candidatus Limnocylindria bacterium]